MNENTASGFIKEFNDIKAKADALEDRLKHLEESGIVYFDKGTYKITNDAKSYMQHRNHVYKSGHHDGYLQGVEDTRKEFLKKERERINKAFSFERLCTLFSDSFDGTTFLDTNQIRIISRKCAEIVGKYIECGYLTNEEINARKNSQSRLIREIFKGV